MYKKFFYTVLSVLVFSFLIFAGCGKKEGTLVIQLTDSPADSASSIVVKVQEVTIHSAGGDTGSGWISVAGEKTVDLKKLENVTTVLGSKQLEAGKYTQIRFIVATTGNYIIIPPDTTNKIPLDVPSNSVKLNHPFDVPEGGDITITLDLDAKKSIVKQGNGGYKLDPVIGLSVKK
jgi:hypothetical protein